MVTKSESLPERLRCYSLTTLRIEDRIEAGNKKPGSTGKWHRVFMFLIETHRANAGANQFKVGLGGLTDIGCSYGCDDRAGDHVRVSV